jgi:xanthine/uracil/vitamin C permease (AzgA family)
MATEADKPPDVDAATAAKAANRFDIRRIIGGLFIVYGAILTVVGIVGTTEIKEKAAGINVNLWTGLGMLVVGAMMIAWALRRPVEPKAPR